MARQDLRQRLADGRPLVMDGAMGSELQRRGVWVSHGATDAALGAWSATAMRDAPEVVREVHDDYFRAGADLAITNSFWTNSAWGASVRKAASTSPASKASAAACPARGRKVADE